MLFCCEHRKQQVLMKRKNSLGLSLGLTLTREKEENSRSVVATGCSGNSDWTEKEAVEEDPYAVPAAPSEAEITSVASGKVLATMWTSVPSSKKRKYGVMCSSYKESILKQLDGREDKKAGRRKKDPLAPKAPSSAYMYFAKHHRPKFKHKYSEATFGDLGKLVGALWKNATDDQRRPFIEQADRDKQRHHLEMEDYKRILIENGRESPLAPSPTEASSVPSSSLQAQPLVASPPSAKPIGIGPQAFAMGMGMGMGLKTSNLDEMGIGVSLGMAWGSMNMGIPMAMDSSGKMIGALGQSTLPIKNVTLGSVVSSGLRKVPSASPALLTKVSSNSSTVSPSVARSTFVSKGFFVPYLLLHVLF